MECGWKQIKATKIISLYAGSWLNKVEVNYNGNGNSVLDVVAGIMIREQPGVKYLNEKTGMLTYWEPTNKADRTTGVACIITHQLST